MVSKAQVIAEALAAGPLDSIYERDIEARSAVYATYRASNPCPLCEGTGRDPNAPFVFAKLLSSGDCPRCDGYGIDWS